MARWTCSSFVRFAEAEEEPNRAAASHLDGCGTRTPELAGAEVALTRLRGHLPKGGYDVPYGQDRWTPRKALKLFNSLPEQGVRVAIHVHSTC
jgi:hypothetical protein